MAEDALSPPAEPGRLAMDQPSPSSAPSRPLSSSDLSSSPRTSGSESNEATTHAVAEEEDHREAEAKGRDKDKAGAKANSDGKKRRKRTSAKDWAFLWAYFKRNSRPNASQRAEIANHVDMDSEGVRIWFQNRRSERARKCSRELSAEELHAYQIGRLGEPHQSAPSGSLSGDTSFNSDHANPSPPHPAALAQDMSPPSQAAGCLSCSAPASPSSQEHPYQTQQFPQRHGQRDHGLPAPALVGKPSEPRPLLSRSFSGPTGYLSNRWNTAASYSTGPQPRPDDPFRDEPYPSSCPPSLSVAPGPAFPPPEPQSAGFRLSLSMEGKAVVVPSVASPPRRTPPSQPLVDLTPRSRALPTFQEFAESVVPKNSGPLPPRLTRGRSRDVNAWEYCCDSQIREDPLTAQARHESSGSATAAISLLRSTSSTGGNALQPSGSAKRNAGASRGSSRPAAAKRPRLNKASSSSARLDAARQFWAKPVNDPYSDKPKHGGFAPASGNDSDKENWSPDEDGNPRRPFGRTLTNGGSSNDRRPLPSGPLPRLDGKNPRRTQQQPSRPRTFLHSRAHTAPATAFERPRQGGRAASPPLEIYEDADDDESDSHLARGAAAGHGFPPGDTSPAKGDINVAKTLVELSQSAWR